MKKQSHRRKPNAGGRVEDVRFVEVDVAQSAPVRQMVVDLGDGVGLRVGMEGIGLAAALIEHLRELRGEGGAS